MIRARLLAALLLAWVTGILFPMYSVTRVDPACRGAFDWVFHTEASHVIMHTFLYGMLATLLYAVMPKRIGASALPLAASVMAGIIAVAMLQEAIQMVCTRSPLGPDEFFDLFVDINGAILGLMLSIRPGRARASR